MERVGISFLSTLTSDEVRKLYINPFRAALERDGAGIYSNYLRQICLKLEVEKIGLPEELSFQNLNPSQPGY